MLKQAIASHQAQVGRFQHRLTIICFRFDTRMLIVSRVEKCLRAPLQASLYFQQQFFYTSVYRINLLSIVHMCMHTILYAINFAICSPEFPLTHNHKRIIITLFPTLKRWG